MVAPISYGFVGLPFKENWEVIKDEIERFEKSLNATTFITLIPAKLGVVELVDSFH